MVVVFMVGLHEHAQSLIIVGVACITGGIAEAYYGQLPKSIANKTITYLDNSLRDIVDQFYTLFNTVLHQIYKIVKIMLLIP